MSERKSREVAFPEEAKYSDHELERISAAFHGIGYPVAAVDMKDLSVDAIQRLFVRFAKDEALDYETRGREVFGESWQANRWI